jgi:hypothetical protein
VEGPIVIKASHFLATINLGRDGQGQRNIGRQHSVELVLPYRGRILVSRDPQDAIFRMMVPDSVGWDELPIDDKGYSGESLSFLGPGDSAIRIKDSRQIIVIGVPIGAFRSGGEARAFGHYEVILPNSERIRVEAGKVAELSGLQAARGQVESGLHGVIVTLGSVVDETKRAELGGAGQVACLGCEFHLQEGARIPVVIGEMAMVGASGWLEVGLRKFDLSGAGNIFLGGVDVQVEEESRGRMRIRGLSKPVILNGVVLSQSVWSYISDQVRGGIVGAVLAALLSSLLFRRQKRE